MCVKTPTQHCRKLIINAVDLCLCAKRRRLQRIEWLQHDCNTWAVQKRISVETGSHAGKASSECRPPSAKTIIFPTAGSTFPWNCGTKQEGKFMRGLIKKKKENHRCVCINDGSVAASQIWTAPSTGRIVHLAANSVSLVLRFPFCVIIDCATLHFNRSFCAKQQQLQQPAWSLQVKVSRWFLVSYKVTG